MSDTPTTHDVDLLVVGAGPTGLTAAIAARAHGLSVRIVDKSAAATPFSKALVLHSRSMEVFDDLGGVSRLLAAGREFRALHLLGGERTITRIQFDTLDWHDAPYPVWFTIPQGATERCLDEHLASKGIHVERETTASTLDDDGSAVVVELAGPGGAVERVRAAWALGADGARSDVRRSLGIPLDGETGGDVFILADVALETALPDAEGFNILARDGVLLIVPLDVPGRVRLIAHMPALTTDEVPVIDAAFLQRLLDTRCPVEARVTDVGWTSHFVPKHMLARAYRRGRVFLAGDAAHLHSPVGGQGLNTGIQDAYNLVWKLALVHQGHAAPTLLDTYEEERRAIADKMVRAVAKATRALTLRSGLAQSARNRAARVLLTRAGVRNRLGPGVGMLDVRYAPSLVVADEEWGRFARGPRPGDRAPLLASRPALFDALRGPSHTLLLLDGERAPFDDADARMMIDAMEDTAGSAPVQIVRVVGRRVDGVGAAATIVDDDGAIRAAYGARAPVAVWVRPDKYIGFRGGAGDAAALRRHLGALFSSVPSGRDVAHRAA